MQIFAICLQIGTCNFRDLRFHNMAIRFLFFRWYEKNFVSTLNTRFSWACAFTKLIFRSVEHTDQPKQKHLCLWTKANWSRNDPSRWFTLVLIWITLAWIMCISVGAVWVVLAYINENSAHRNENKKTDKGFKIVFLIFLHYIPHEICIYHGIKCRRHDK